MTEGTKRQPPSPQPAVVHSSAAFLHHLHTDPTSHHITLSASAARLPGSAPNKSPRSINVPLEPTVVERNKPSGERMDAQGNPTAGPSRGTGLLRSSSGRGRPTSAPGDQRNSNNLPCSTVSPEFDDVARMGDYPYSPAEELPQLPSGGDSCVGMLVSQEGEQDANNNMRLATGSGASFLLGLSGSVGSMRSESSSARSVASGQSEQEGMDTSSEQLSWKTFSKSYAHGLFDPNRTPNPPASSVTSPVDIPSVHSSPGRRYQPLSVAQRRAETLTSASSQGTLSSASDGSGRTMSTYASSDPAAPADKTLPTTTASALPTRFKALELENLRVPKSPAVLRPDKLSLPSYSLAAATVRMASHTMRESDFAPLGVPSPERELLDPLATFTTGEAPTITKESPSSDSGIGRYPLSRSMSSAVGASSTPQAFLPTIQASPVSTPHEGTHKAFSISPPAFRGGALSRIPAATAPIEKVTEAESAFDYFGSISAPHYERLNSSTSHSSSSQTEKGTPAAVPAVAESPPFQLPSIALPKDIADIYDHVGWLPAPIPPDELDRRKALYRFGILHTAKDINFDRIAHMAKLVFNTKIVLIALTDSDTQWHKSQTGLGVDKAKRISSFCSHTILAKTDEPFVVLDATQDWRFMNNPQVVGAPHIRFYAGAPLRTADGHNVGSLCIIDDKPRAEFPPRSRLILKEFAAVTMREMELWRDKLQLRVRDRIQTSMEKFTRECLELDASTTNTAEAAAKMDQVYSRAAQLVCSTLDLDGCFILDIGTFEATEIETANGRESVFRADPYVSELQSPVLERSQAFGSVNPFPVLATTPSQVPTRPLTAEEHEKLSTFLRDNRDGKIFENVAPSWIRYMFPASLRYGMVVPVYGVDQQPFAMICAYTCNKAKQYLEGYELQFLRAIGVIILSAVLRRRMVLADKTKSILISSVSHELRTPLHGILAAAELLSDTNLDANQISFLKTVQTCGNSLIETVNHVLDFTKLSGATSNSSGSTIKHARVDLASLVESTVEGCWIGQRARFFHGDSDIGSFYAPPAPSGLLPKHQRDTVGAKLAHVETVIDIAKREKGWKVRCEKGGLRRVLMNLVGNSLKFTTDGYVQVTLRELPHPPGSNKIPIEMAVIDTGKGISKEFLKEHLFHPFSQENPLQTGTGLGLAIVNSIVRSESVDGKVDVWSSEGMGTEIRVSFEAEVIDDEDDSISSASSVTSLSSTPGRGRSISLVGFHTEHRGHMLSLEVLSAYAAAWQFDLDSNGGGDIIVINDDDEELAKVQNTDRPIIYLATARQGRVTALRDSIVRAGGSCQIMYKPIGPSALRATLQQAVQFIEGDDMVDMQGPPTPTLEERPSISRGSSGASVESNSTVSELSMKKFDSRAPLMRRRSEETEAQRAATAVQRPTMAPRGLTYHHAPKRSIPSFVHPEETTPSSVGSPQPGSPASTISTISLADGGVMLKSAAVPIEGAKRERSPRVLVVEDNVINRRVLGAFLKKRGMEYMEAVNGRAGVEIFESSPSNYWDVILMDISMPVMNGHEATRAIRKIESGRRNSVDSPVIPPPGTPIKIAPPKIVQARAKIFALTGLATADDKREAFGSGVDGYLVKPVSLKSLGLIFQKIGFPVDTPN